MALASVSDINKKNQNTNRKLEEKEMKIIE